MLEVCAAGTLSSRERSKAYMSYFDVWTGIENTVSVLDEGENREASDNHSPWMGKDLRTLGRTLLE